jgi:hypothetical protein
MSAPIVELAQELTDLLNTPNAFTPALNATRGYQIYFELPDVKTTKVTVYGSQDRTASRSTRGNDWRHEQIVEIAVQKKTATDANAEKDAVVLLADTICEYVKDNWLDDEDEHLESATCEALLNNERMNQHKLFTVLIRLTFIAHR